MAGEEDSDSPLLLKLQKEPGQEEHGKRTGELSFNSLISDVQIVNFEFHGDVNSSLLVKELFGRQSLT